MYLYAVNQPEIDVLFCAVLDAALISDHSNASHLMTPKSSSSAELGEGIAGAAKEGVTLPPWGFALLLGYGPRPTTHGNRGQIPHRLSQLTAT